MVDRNGYATVYEYDANGNRTAVRYANGIIVTYDYDLLNRLTCQKVLDIDGEVMVQYTYALGLAGERLSASELDRTVEYTYDNLYRLTGETITEGEKVTTYTYAYDSVGNRILKTVNGVETVYSYNALNQLVSEGDITYEYDLNGNLVRVIGTGRSALYEYNSENKLVKATVQQGNNVVVETYTYDYAGNRTSKTTSTNGQVEYVKYLNDNSSLTNVLAELDSEGNVQVCYTIGADLISQERNGKTSFYLYNGHGSVTALANESGVVTDTYTYDAFGNLLDSTGNTKNCYLYCGEQFDSTTGLYYLRARYMDTSTGRFISQDSYAGDINDPVSLHKYLYCNSDPVNNVDPSGYLTFVGAIVASAVCGILASMATTYLSNVFALRDQTGEFDWSWNLSVDDVCVSVLIGGGLGALGAIALMCQFVVATSILIASAAGFGIYSLYECIENVKSGNISTAIFQGTLALISVFSIYGMGKTMGSWRSKPPIDINSDANYSQHFEDQMTPEEAARYRRYWSQHYTDKGGINTRPRIQAEPGTKSIIDYVYSKDNYGYYRETIYDQYGRKIATVDYTTHNRPDVHTNPHYHENPPTEPTQHGKPIPGDYLYRK